MKRDDATMCLFVSLAELAHSGCMSSFRWNGGGDLKNRKWDTDLPTDSAVCSSKHLQHLNAISPVHCSLDDSIKDNIDALHLLLLYTDANTLTNTDPDACAVYVPGLTASSTSEVSRRKNLYVPAFYTDT